jgi:hypothetical protein
MLTDGIRDIRQRQVVRYTGDVEETQYNVVVGLRNRDHSDAGMQGPSKILGDSTGQNRNISIKSLWKLNENKTDLSLLEKSWGTESENYRILKCEDA